MNDERENGTGADNEERVPNPPRASDKGAARTTSSGPLIGIIIIVLVLAIGGVYFWKTMVTEQRVLPTDTMSADADGVVAELKAQGASDEVTHIEADLEATNLEDLDTELQLIEAGLE